MWIALLIIVALVLIFILLWLLNPQEDHYRTTLEEVKTFHQEKGDKLDNEDRQSLKKTIERMEKELEKRERFPMKLLSSCCRRELNDAYEQLIALYTDLSHKH